jgi:hypothetical protein
VGFAPLVGLNRLRLDEAGAINAPTTAALNHFINLVQPPYK